jgi:hypothetical protein
MLREKLETFYAPDERGGEPEKKPAGEAAEPAPAVGAEAA